MTQDDETRLPRRRVLRTGALLAGGLVVGGAATGSATAEPPGFADRIYADGDVWDTRGVTQLPPPNDHNEQSFDKLFAVTNGVDGQLPVGEAAPRNSNYNGGRWDTQTVTWKADATPVLLKSYDDIRDHGNDLTITAGSPNPPNPPDYFECPLVGPL